MTFGERLKLLREGKYSQEELANMLNVHSVTISKWENNVQEPRANKVAELARILGTTTAYLLGDTDNPSQEKSAGKFLSDKTSGTYPSLAYWGEVADNARQVAKDGQDLNLIYSLLANATNTIKAAMSLSSSHVSTV